MPFEWEMGNKHCVCIYCCLYDTFPPPWEIGNCVLFGMSYNFIVIALVSNDVFNI